MRNPNVNVVKIGGSAFDKGLDLVWLLAGKIKEQSQKCDFIITVGRGELANPRTDNNSLRILILNSNVFCDFLEKRNCKSKVIVPGDSNNIRSALLDGYLPIVPYVNVESLGLSYREKFPSDKSDVNTLLIAEEFNAVRCIFIKDTCGICSNDPNNPMYRNLPVVILDSPHKLDEEIKDTTKLYIYRNIGVSEIKEVFKNDHLVERMCVELLKKTHRIECIYIIDAKEPKQLGELLSGVEVGSKLYKEQESHGKL